VTVEVEVWDLLIQRPFHLLTAFAYPEGNPLRIHGSRWNEDLKQAYWDAHFENGIDIDQLYRSTPPSWEDIEKLLEMGS